MSDSETAQCPLCMRHFPLATIAEHADGCTGAVAAPAAPAESHDSDFEFAKKLQAELDAAAGSGGGAPGGGGGKKVVRCEKCSETVPLEDVYILDECSHRFCTSCIRDWVAEKLATSVAVGCPVTGCKRPLSVRDMKIFVPQAIAQARSGKGGKGGGGGGGGASSKKATARLVEELRHITESKPEKNGYRVNPIDDNLYRWQAEFFDFDSSDPIAQDMRALKVRNIVLEVTFPPDYPFSPPFVRVVRPRFAFHTGHVTVGGSLCNELLSRTGWSPETTIEAVLMTIRSSFMAGGARLDRSNRSDYTMQEAKAAYDRMLQVHGWS